MSENSSGKWGVAEKTFHTNEREAHMAIVTGGPLLLCQLYPSNSCRQHPRHVDKLSNAAVEEFSQDVPCGK